MKPFVTPYTIRWNDLDANRHAANTTFVALFTDTRMQFLNAHGVTQTTFAEHNMGPVIFNENIHYLRELNGGEQVYVDLELNGMSENGTFFEFNQHLYNSKGEIAAFLNIIAAWFSLETRKLISPPPVVMEMFQAVPKTEGFRFLQKQDIRRVAPELTQRTLDLSQLPV